MHIFYEKDSDDPQSGGSSFGPLNTFVCEVFT